LGANFDHRTGGLVAQHHRLFDHEGADGAVFVVMHVAGADAHGVNGNLHVMGADFQRQVDVAQRQFTFAFEY
jgi:hypothetical protein